MSRREPAASDSHLARLIRGSRDLPPSLRRQWLRVLPHLSIEERAELLATLTAATDDTSTAS
ncbi:MAG: hypothetical protein U0821_04660 [Chloroflexota bacterium]